MKNHRERKLEPRQERGNVPPWFVPAGPEGPWRTGTGVHAPVRPPAGARACAQKTSRYAIDPNQGSLASDALFYIKSIPEYGNGLKGRSARGRGMRPEACRCVERQAVRMHQMMRRLDVDPGTLIRVGRGEAYGEARKRCLACTATGDCLRWLDGYALEGESPDFCPNLQLFRLLQGRTALMLPLERQVQPGPSGRVSGAPAARLPGGTVAGSNEPATA